MSESFVKKPNNGPHSALAGLGVLSTEKTNTIALLLEQALAAMSEVQERAEPGFEPDIARIPAEDWRAFVDAHAQVAMFWHSWRESPFSPATDAPLPFDREYVFGYLSQLLRVKVGDTKDPHILALMGWLLPEAADGDPTPVPQPGIGPQQRLWPDGKRAIAQPCGLCLGLGCRMCNGTGRYETQDGGNDAG